MLPIHLCVRSPRVQPSHRRSYGSTKGRTLYPSGSGERSKEVWGRLRVTPSTPVREVLRHVDTEMSPPLRSFPYCVRYPRFQRSCWRRSCWRGCRSQTSPIFFERLPILTTRTLFFTPHTIRSRGLGGRDPDDTMYPSGGRLNRRSTGWEKSRGLVTR